MELLLYARVLSIGIVFSLESMLYARVLRKFFGVDAIRKGFKESETK